jgi:nucleoside-diphosphate-sugar epimerase
MLMLKPQTYGKRYNITGGDCYTDEGYVDTFADILERDVEKVFIPPSLMDDLYAGKVAMGSERMKTLIDTRSAHDPKEVARFQVSRLIQRLAPNLHHWNRSLFFSTERLRQDTGWEPEYTFRGAVEQTWNWMKAEGLDRTLDFDFSFEDDLLAEIAKRAQGAA